MLVKAVAHVFGKLHDHKENNHTDDGCESDILIRKGHHIVYFRPFGLLYRHCRSTPVIKLDEKLLN
jgi:hypothetical protein